MRNEPEIENRAPSQLSPVEAGGPFPSADHRPGPDVDPDALVQRYVATWMEPEPSARRRRIEELWAPGGTHVLEAPRAIRETARSVGFPNPALEVRGYDALEFRVTRAHEEFVAPGKFSFRPCGDAVRLQDVVKFHWEMRSVADGSVAGAGLDVLLLDPDGRIRVDYQFIEG
jgi:hypothetical protein